MADSHTKRGSKPTNTKSLTIASDLQLLSPAEVIFYMLDEATRNHAPDGHLEFGFAGTTFFHHRELDNRINEYVERLLGDRVTDLGATDE